MGKRNKNEASNEGGGEGSWLVTFSDLCTLLLTFFVLLLSMSSLNKRAFRMTFQNFDASSGILNYNENESVIMPHDMAIKDLCKSLKSVHVLDVRDAEEISEKEAKSDENFNLLVSSGNAVWFHEDEQSGSFSFLLGNRLLFESGSAILNPQAYPILTTLGNFLRDSEYTATIDGHTDSIPIHNEQFASNEDLSIARALAVLEYLWNHCGINPKRLALGGYGSLCPIAANDKETGRELNRRVEIIFRKNT